ncbi:hypothetical protein TYRP_022934 [Tyrophagus putrescentiae]|nr:hypothetical protein TYRP_022934 [Tyrophagus putrescentiae]
MKVETSPCAPKRYRRTVPLRGPTTGSTSHSSAPGDFKTTKQAEKLKCDHTESGAASGPVIACDRTVSRAQHDCRVTRTVTPVVNTGGRIYLHRPPVIIAASGPSAATPPPQNPRPSTSSEFVERFPCDHRLHVVQVDHLFFVVPVSKLYFRPLHLDYSVRALPFDVQFL